MRLHFEERDSWRAWLAEHHDTKRVVWLVFYKAHTGRRSISVEAAIEEALCFGWVDSLIKRLDDRRYLLRFMPRSDTGKWSKLNLNRVQHLVKTGRMTEIGLAKLDAGVKPVIPPARRRFTTAPPFFKQALAANTRARANFARLAPSHRRRFLGWVTMAKKEDTRQRRLLEVIRLLEQNKKLGLK
jgi:uncharacterized protein YdeI (YjbR/CyaY-like superfamily)